MNWQRIIQRICASLFVGAFLSHAHAEEKFYVGKVGTRTANFTLEWHENESVTGWYYCPDGARRTYALRGHNRTEGRLELDELTEGHLTARLSLAKKTDGNRIFWEGTLSNLDGRVLAVRISRSRQSIALAPLPPLAGGKEYLAIWSDPVTTEKFKSRAQLQWIEGGEVTGILANPGDGNPIQLTARNDEEGKLRGTASYKDGRKVEFELTKSNKAHAVVWSGQFIKPVTADGVEDSGMQVLIDETMYNVLGRIELLRRTDGDKVPTEKSDLFSKVPSPALAMTRWRQPTYMSRALDYDEFDKIDGTGQSTVNGYPGTITGIGYTNGELRIDISLKPREDQYDFKFYVPQQPHVSLVIENYPVRPAFSKIGDGIWVSTDNAGEIIRLGLNECAITHWRKRSDGLVEVKALPYSTELDGGYGVKQSYSTAKHKSIHMVPDKLARGTFDGTLPWRTLYLDRLLGLVLRVDAAGPGELELESTPVLRPKDEAHWIPEQDESATSPVPPKQRAYDAG